MPRLVLSELLVRIRRSAASRRPSQVDERSLLAPPFHPHLDPAAPGRLIASRCSSVRRSRRPARALAGVEALRRIWPTCFASSKRQAQIGLVLPEWAECHAALVFVVDIARRRRPWLSLLLLLLSLLALPRPAPLLLVPRPRRSHVPPLRSSFSSFSSACWSRGSSTSRRSAPLDRQALPSRPRQLDVPTMRFALSAAAALLAFVPALAAPTGASPLPCRTL